MSKEWEKKPSPNPRGVEGQNLHDYFFYCPGDFPARLDLSG